MRSVDEQSEGFVHFPYASLGAITDDEYVFLLALRPDEESLSCGGYIAESCARGRPPFVAILTDGSSTHPNSNTYPPDRLSVMRERATRLAVSLLQLPADRLLFIGLYDNTVPAEGLFFDIIVHAIGLIMWRRDCNVICAPWQPNARGDHQAIQRIATTVAGQTGVGLIWYATPASQSPGRPMVTDQPAAGYRLNIAPHLPAKRRAIAAHESQFGRSIVDDPRAQRPSERILAACDRPYEIFLRTN